MAQGEAFADGERAPEKDAEGQPVTLCVGVREAEGEALAQAVGHAECVSEAPTLREPDWVARDAVALSVPAAVALAGAVADTDGDGWGDVDTEPVGQGEAVGESVPEPHPLAVAEGLAEWEADPLRERVPEAV